MPSPVEDIAQGESLGAYLKRVRESKGLSLEDLSQKTKLSLEILQKVEAGEWKKFPIEAYIRSYLNSISKTLGLEPGRVLAFYSQEAGSSYSREFQAEDSISMDGGNFSGEKLRHGNGTTKVVIIILLLLAAAFFACMHFLNKGASPAAEEKSPTPAVMEDTSSFEQEIPEGAENIPADSSSVDSLPMQAALDSARKEAAKGNSATTFITSSESKADTAAPKAVNGKIRISVEALDSASAWVGFYRSLNDNAVLKEGNITPNRKKISFEYADTLCAVIGNPDAVRQMLVNGKAVSIPIIKGRSSRFCIAPNGKFTRR